MSSSSVHAVVDFYGLVNLDSEIKLPPNDIISPWLLSDYLGVAYKREDALKASAVEYVTENTVPVMILQGGEDIAVPLEQSEAFYEKLQQKGVFSELYVIEDAGHDDETFYQDEVLDVVDCFLQKALKQNM